MPSTPFPTITQDPTADPLERSRPAPAPEPPSVIGQQPTGCAATRADGRPCRFPTRLNHTHCINHDPAYRDQQAANRRVGVRAATHTRQLRARLRRTTALYELDEWALADRASIQAVLDAVIRLELAGRIPNHRSRNVIRALAIAVRNFDTPPTDTTHARTYRHNLDRYRRARHVLDANLEALCNEADSRDQDRAHR